ncbi:MAG: hypothetical protein WCL42_01735 [Chlorobiaceae bacterium]|jgi:hypothetical protein
MNIDDVLKKNETMLRDLPNVTGVGIGEKNGKEVIIVFVTHKVPESELDSSDIVPKYLEGQKTDIRPEIKVGEI